MSVENRILANGLTYTDLCLIQNCYEKINVAISYLDDTKSDCKNLDEAASQLIKAKRELMESFSQVKKGLKL